jgi:NAD+--asparagine ADP-ribosyltransferase
MTSSIPSSFSHIAWFKKARSGQAYKAAQGQGKPASSPFAKKT